MIHLEDIGRLAIFEHLRWLERNKARNEYRDWLRRYRNETGEWFVREEAEPEDVTAFDAVQAATRAAQKALTKARGATRRLTARAAAEIGKTMEDPKP